MATMSYGSYEFIPVPMITMSRNFVRTDSEDTELYTDVNLTLNGILINPSGAISSASGFKSLWEQREELETAVQLNRQSFQVNADDGEIVLSVFPNVSDINFEGGDVTDANAVWVRWLKYQISMDYQEDAPDNIQAFDETFSYQEQEDDIIAVTHTVNVTGLNNNFGPGSGTSMANARTFALSAISNDIGPVFVDILGGFGKRNIIKSEEFSPSDGTYSLTEQYIYASGDFTESFTVSIENNVDAQQVVGTIDGEIIGYGDNRTERFANASGAYPAVSGLAFPRVQSVTPTVLNPNPTSFSQGWNEFIGTVNYSFTYNDDPTPSTSGAANETIRISYNNPTQVFASIPIPGRASGPILQNIRTQTSTVKTLTANVTFEKTFGGPFVFDVTQFEPDVSISFKSQDSENFDIISRAYNRTVSWTFNGSDPLGFTIPSGLL